MPTPNWTAQYLFNNTPEQNGFTRQLVGGAAINLQQSGPPSGRNVTIITSAFNDQGVLLTSQVPSLDWAVGATAEIIVAVTGAGDAGIELDFLAAAILIQIYQTRLLVSYIDDVTGEHNLEFPTPDNSAPTTWRITIGSSTLNVYRAGVLVATVTLGTSVRPFQRVLWWGESGGTMIFTELAYYIGGPVAP